MRLVPVLLAISSLAVLNQCSSDLSHHSSGSAHHPQVFTGATQYYHRGADRSFPQPAVPPQVPPWNRPSWARTTAPPSTSARPSMWMRATSTAPARVSSTHGPTFANADGTTSTVIGNALVRSDGTKATMIGNTAYHSNGTKSRIVGDTLMNADGSQSSRINESP